MSTDVDNVIQLRAERGEPSHTQYDVELPEPEPTGPLEPAEPAPETRPRIELRPILPSSLRRGNFRPAAELTIARTKHRVAYHGLRTPKYLILGFAWGVVGWFKLGDKLINDYWLLRDASHWKRQAKKAGEQLAWEDAHKRQTDARKNRTPKMAIGAGLVVGALAFLGIAVGWFMVPLAVLAAWPIVAHHGRPDNKPIISAAVLTYRERHITQDIVIRAYASAGLCKPDDPDQQLDVYPPGMERDGRGSRITVGVPYGRTFKEVMERRAKIASGMDVSLNQIFLTKDKISERAHELYIPDSDPLAIPAGRTPLLRCKPTDIWKPAPFGVDERGQRVNVDMLWKSILVGAQPRYGKSFSARLLGLYAALDPYVKLSVFNGEAKPDWRAFKMVAHQYAAGLVMTRDGDPIEIFIESLEEIKRDVQRRYRALSEMDTDICPEGKLTRQIARNKAYDMPVRLVVIDEVQEFFNTGNKDADAKIASLLTYLVKVAPAAGLIVLDATQKPAINTSGQIPKMFTDFRDQHTLRFALKCGSRDVSDMILGAGAYSAGFDASALSGDEEYRGVGILLGAGMPGHTVRTYLADAQDAEKILKVAQAMRREHGTLTGQAAGDEPNMPSRDVLADTRAMFLPGETFAPWEQLATRLKERMSENYDEIDKDTISAWVRNLGVPSQDGREQTGPQHQRRVLKGVYARELDKVMAGRGHGDV